MRRLQDLTFILGNSLKIELFLVEHSASTFRALLTLPTASAKMISWHEVPQPHGDAAAAFKWAVRHAQLFCKRAGTTIEEIANTGESEFLSAEDQWRIAESEGIAAKMRVNGALLG